jgi:hypothetical protein
MIFIKVFINNTENTVRHGACRPLFNPECGLAVFAAPDYVKDFA